MCNNFCAKEFCEKSFLVCVCATATGDTDVCVCAYVCVCVKESCVWKFVCFFKFERGRNVCDKVACERAVC